MTIFSKQRYQHPRMNCVRRLFTLLTFLFGLTCVSAQSGSEVFRGAWQIETPDDGALILIVKRGGLASYFWGDTTDRNVYQGAWTSTENVATLSWEDGSRHEIQRDALGFGISYYSAANTLAYTVPAQQVPNEILGQWAKPPSRTSELASARDRAKGFFGIWQIGDGQQFLFVEPDRSAAKSEGGRRGLRGSWAKQGSELHIVWDNGKFSILRENERSFDYKIVTSGAIIEDDKTKFVSAKRTTEENVSASWLSQYRKERELRTGGIAFSSRKNARAFYRGTWLVRLQEDIYERIEIGRFGGLSTSVDRSLEGSWRMDGQDIFMRWDNGSRRILSPVGDGFVLYEYKPSRPLDGVPTRTYAAAPADASKLEKHLEGREDVAKQMIALAEAAGIDPNEEAAGWGRTFARWAWPFRDSSGTSTEALLVDGYAETPETHPWWWPFWSESAVEAKPELNDATAVAESREDVSSEEVESEQIAAPELETSITAEEITDSVDEATEEDSNTPRTRKSSPKDWVWPF